MSRIIALRLVAASALLLLSAYAAFAADAEVKIDNFTFNPQQVKVKAGTTVTWVNSDDIPHTVASKDNLFKSKVLDTDNKFSFTFTTPGSFIYFLLLASAHDGDNRGGGGGER